MFRLPFSRLYFLYGTIVGLGSFLIFLVQPLAVRALLPVFGGVPAVWAASLACFQSFLFLGYLLAHLLRTKTSELHQALTILAILLLSSFSLPLLPLKAQTANHSVWEVALAVTMGVGPVFLALAALGPLVQSWAKEAGDGVYRLYAVSSAASLIALLIFPTLLERSLDAKTLSSLWEILFVLEILLVIWAILNGRQKKIPSLQPVPAKRPSKRLVLIWMAWAAAGVTILNASTTVLAQTLASVPLLWVIPLSLYLITWFIAFAVWPPNRSNHELAMAVTALVLLILALGPACQTHLLAGILMILGAMTAACLAAHCSLASTRPDPNQLTGFYLAIAGGGALGGVFSGLAAPSWGPCWIEILVGYGAVALLAVTSYKPLRSARWVRGLAAIAMIGLLGTLAKEGLAPPTGTILEHRDMFGLIRVVEQGRTNTASHRIVLMHGCTKHGAQFLAPDLRNMPTTYYAPTTGCGIALATQRNRQRSGLRIGVVGLGIGSLAAYGQPGDSMVFYELSPAMINLARGGSVPAFTYLTETPAQVKIVEGDARISLARELEKNPSGEQFDLLVLDAFAGDAVPQHLLTREAFSVYTAHLSGGGMIAAHISSNWIDLRPALYAWAQENGWRALTIANHASGPADFDQVSTWVLLFQDFGCLRTLRDLCLPLMDEGIIQVENMIDVDYGDLVAWTDSRGGLLDALTTRIVARDER